MLCLCTFVSKNYIHIISRFMQILCMFVAPTPLSSTIVTPEDELDSILLHDISPIDGGDTMWDGSIDSADVPFLTDWVKDLGLTQADCAILIEGRCLTASHMSAASKLLRGQFPHQNGLVDTSVLSHKRSYDSNPYGFVQIIFVAPNHWACLSNKFASSNTVDLYDSLHTTPTKDGSIVLLTCRILQSLKLTKLSIRVVNVSVQEDGTDCGLHAIAMAMDLCCDVDPFLLDYENVNRGMRKHLSCCFEERMLSQFPSQPIEREDRLLGTVHIDLYCVCRQPEHGQMACCDECDTWYDPGCIYIPEDVLGDENDLIPWSCPSCECY